MSLSFSGSAKEEICRDLPQKRCCCQAMAYGILLFANTFSSEVVRIVTESREFAWILPRLFEKAFDMEFDSYPSLESPGKLVFQINEPWKLEFIMDAYGFDPDNTLALHVNLSVLEEECCRGAFLRGVFLSGGSVMDPAKSYHLEVATSHAQASRELQALLTDMGRKPKQVARGGYQVTYFKNSDQIEDMLTKMGAPISAMEIMNAKAEKELRNGINRRVNCEAANLDKAVDAAQEQLEAIRRLYELDRVEGLTAQLKETIILRETFPELTLSQLAEEFDPPVTKSCLNHRLRKLVELSKQ